MNLRSANITLPLLIISTIAVAAVLYVLHSLLVPLVVAGFLAIIFKPLVAMLLRVGAPTWVALIVVLLITGASLYLMSLIVTWGVQSAINKAPAYADRLSRMIDRAQQAIGEYGGSLDTAMLNQIESMISPDQVISVAGSWLGSALSFVADSTLVLLFLIFMVLGGDVFARKLQLAFRDVPSLNVMRIYETLNMKVIRYLRLKTLVNLFLGLLVYGILELFGVDFAPVMGLLTFLLHYLPNIGSFIMTAIPGLVAVIQFESFGYALIIVGVLIVVQNLVGNIIEPKIMGSSLDLSPVVVLFALIFWGWMWGIVGMILSVPIMAVLKTVMEQFPTTRPIAILMGNTVPEPPTIET